MRDAARIREKIELRLDNRQVVGLVLGAAVVLGVVFYLGVGVGRHLGAAVPTEKTDPLARLDEHAEVGALTFADTLTAEGKAKPSPAAPPVTAPPVPKPPPAPVVDTGPAAGRDAPAAAIVLATPTTETGTPAPAATGAAPSPTEPLPSVADALAAVDARTAARTDPAPSTARVSEGSETFTVQAAALPSRAEADAFAAKLRKRGLSPTVIAADVPGKGTFYRVRLGKFQTREAADRYLKDFQRETGLSGFVTTTGK